MKLAAAAGPALTTREVLITWWPLALSWLLMTVELPITSAVIPRLLSPEVNLAAWGVVFNLAVTIQAPGTMLLAASTALVNDAASFRRLGRITAWILVTLTLVHLLIAFTPLYDVVFRTWLGLPAEVADAARLAVMITFPWSAATGSRRFFHGILIRYGHSHAVIKGTGVRLGIGLAILGTGLLLGSIPGAVLTAVSLSCATIAEAIYAYWRARPVIRNEVLTRSKSGTLFTYPAFIRFYTPLVATMLLSLSIVTLISAAIARMPDSLASLAAWPVAFGFLHFWQSPAYGFQEVVISLLRRPNAVKVLKNVTFMMVTGMTVLLLLVSVTPLARLWFEHGAALSPELANLAQTALLLGLLVPALRALQSWLQGAIVFGGRTRSMMESVVIFVIVTAGLLLAGIQFASHKGLYVGMFAYVLGMAAQTAWLAWRARPLLDQLQRRDDSPQDNKEDTHERIGIRI